MRHERKKVLHEAAGVPNGPLGIPCRCATGREKSRTSGAIRLGKGRHIERVGVELLRTEDAEADQTASGVAAEERCTSKVDCRARRRPRRGIRVVWRPSFKVSVDALSCSVRQ